MADNEPTPQTSQDEPLPRKRKGTSHHPVVVLTIYNWFVPILVIIAFILGIILGYLAHAAAPSPAAKIEATPTSTETSLSPEQRQQLMTFLSKETQHYLGDENAPVRMFEFSDFQ